MSSIVAGTQSFARSTVDVALGVFQAILGLLEAIFGIANGVITTALKMIQGTISVAVHLVTRILQSVADLVGGALGFITVRTVHLFQGSMSIPYQHHRAILLVSLWLLRATSSIRITTRVLAA